MIQETIRFLIWSAMFSLLLWGAALLTGCSVEGAGFENSGRLRQKVVCKQVRPNYTECRNVD
jgi:hypothetical protein